MPAPSPTRRKSTFAWRALFVLVVVAAAGVVYLIVASREDKKSALINPGKSVSKSSMAPALGFAFQPGDHLVYHFTSQGMLNMGSANPAQAATVLQISEEGQFSAIVYTATASGWLVGFSCDNAKLTLNNGQSPQDLTPADLAGAEIFITLDKSGRITQVQVPYSLSSDARNSWRDILSKWQVIFPQNTAAKKWTRIEEDATGTFVAQYALAAATITKNKNHYLSIHAANAGLASAYKVAGTAQIQFDDFPRTISGQEQVNIGGVNGLPPTTSTGEYSFTLASFTNRGKPPPPSLANDTSMAWAVEFNAAATPPEDEGNFADNLRDLHAAIENGAFGGPEEVALAGKIIGLIKKDPVLADRLLDELRSDGASTQLASALLGILGAAGTPAAQYDLLAVTASEDWPPAFKQMALFSLVQVAEPVAEADAELKSLFAQGGDLSSSSLLVLAAIGDKVRTSDPARFQQINDFVANVLNTPDLSLNDFVVVLDAIGNLGPAQVPDAIAKATTNDNELIRAKAIASLSRIQTDASLTLVTNAIINDPSGDVQAAAVKTLAALKGADAIPALSNITTDGKSVAARKEALTQLSSFTNSNPNVAAVLNKAAQADPSQEVRDYANKLLGNASSSGQSQQSQP